MTGDFQLEMNEYLPLRDVVFQTLRQAILKGELKPGERLMEIQLAQKLGVSRTPVREAIRKLELIIGGTSLIVYPAAGLIDYYRGNKLVVINMSVTSQDKNADLVIQEPIGKVFAGI